MRTPSSFHDPFAGAGNSVRVARIGRGHHSLRAEAGCPASPTAAGRFWPRRRLRSHFFFFVSFRTLREVRKPRTFFRGFFIGCEPHPRFSCRCCCTVGYPPFFP